MDKNSQKFQNCIQCSNVFCGSLVHFSDSVQRWRCRVSLMNPRFLLHMYVYRKLCSHVYRRVFNSQIFKLYKREVGRNLRGGWLAILKVRFKGGEVENIWCTHDVSCHVSIDPMKVSNSHCTCGHNGCSTTTLWSIHYWQKCGCFTNLFRECVQL